MLEHCHDTKTQCIMMDEILQSVCMLAQDQYGNYVVQVCYGYMDAFLIHMPFFPQSMDTAIGYRLVQFRFINILFLKLWICLESTCHVSTSDLSDTAIVSRLKYSCFLAFSAW